MPRIIPFTRLHPRVAACTAAVLLVCACQTTGKFKRSSGKFPEWETYETKHFFPSNGTVTVIDTTANSVTIVRGNDSNVYPVTSATRIIHEGTDIPLAQLPVNQPVKFTLSQDGQRLLTIWYGQRLYTYQRPGSQAKKQSSL